MLNTVFATGAKIAGDGSWGARSRSAVERERL